VNRHPEPETLHSEPKFKDTDQIVVTTLTDHSATRKPFLPHHQPGDTLAHPLKLCHHTVMASPPLAHVPRHSSASKHGHLAIMDVDRQMEGQTKGWMVVTLGSKARHHIGDPREQHPTVLGDTQTPFPGEPLAGQED
jgi:hypothetical protein